MSLTAGTRLGPYQILAELGRGGMGEVYRATDTRLDRIVAIKILPPHLADSPDLRARFEREARAVSSLNHPHICALYDVGRQDGIDYLVLEFLEGETLDARLSRGPLPLEQALTFAIEISQALEAAHRQGLTHRDLKPGNVMITRGGTKLLDFGLAKPRAAALTASGVDASGVATMVSGPVTSQGAIVGTVQYMAPEQIEGQEADARSDIWALGCVLYEMIGGTRAFTGSTPASLLAAILEREPARLPIDPVATGRLWDVIRTCLEKRPDDRWQTARDLTRELRWCASASPVSTGSAIAQPAPAAPVARRRAVLVGAMAFVATAAVAVAGTLLASRLSAPTAAAAAAAAKGPPVIVLMDSTHPERVYDDETRKAGGTNADDLTDLLRDLPVVLLKENTNIAWHRESEVLQENPALIVAHRSCFYDATILGDASRQTPFVNLSWDKFESFAGLVAIANPRTKVLAYSRGSWAEEADRAKWVTAMEQRFPPLRGRLDAMKVPLDRATFRNPVTGAEIRKKIVALLGLTDPNTAQGSRQKAQDK